jgi:hypothetical protein
MSDGARWDDVSVEAIGLIRKAVQEFFKNLISRRAFPYRAC